MRDHRGLLPTVVLAVLAALGALDAHAVPGRSPELPGIFPPLGGAVGIKVSVSNVHVGLKTADLDLTMYTRYLGPPGTAGVPTYGLPALDYGDGSTLPTTTLALTNTGGGPGGSNVYRSLASFTHTYPSNSNFTARAAMACFLCVHSSYVFFPPGSPAPPTFTQTFDLLPTTVIGNLALPYQYSGTTYVGFLSTSVHYAYTYFLAVTNTAQVALVQPVPALSEWGLIALGLALLVAGIILIRRL